MGSDLTPIKVTESLGECRCAYRRLHSCARPHQNALLALIVFHVTLIPILLAFR